MNAHHPEFQEIYDQTGQPLGAILGPEAWALVREAVLAHYAPPKAVTAGEPLQDWLDLVEYWDFKYPVDRDVACPICNNASDDWQHDEPRKFVLTAANMGGLVAFRCLGCQAKIIKRHFKDEIVVEVKPFTPERSTRNLGRPDTEQA